MLLGSTRSRHAAQPEVSGRRDDSNSGTRFGCTSSSWHCEPPAGRSALSAGCSFYWQSSPAQAPARDQLRQLVIDTLADRLDSEVELESFSVDTFPTVHVTGTNLIIRHKGRRDVPPLIAVRAFTLDGGMIGLVSRPRRFRTATLEGLQINIPPGFKKDHAADRSVNGTAGQRRIETTDRPRSSSTRSRRWTPR